MTIIELKERAAELKEMTGDYMRDEITFTKQDFCLIGAICFLAGICIGMLAAPLTQGIHILSHNVNNGSGNGSKNGNQYYESKDEENT
ncbi:MAG: hypothetical protein K2N00_07480 [Lachnospiraceae bacterium]|nr:hypothetical protein [Lachnospiraceae bacterium]